MVWFTIVIWRMSLVIQSYKSDDDKVCMSKHQYEAIAQAQERVEHQGGRGRVTRGGFTRGGFTRERDLRVLQDPLYPALNRPDRGSFELVMENTARREINVPTRTYNDSYRLVGYLTNSDADIPKWKMFGRQKDRNRGDFYMVPVDRTQDMKVQITDSIIVGDKVRDLDTIPTQISFNSPLLSSTPYMFTELPKADLSGNIDF